MISESPKNVEIREAMKKDSKVVSLLGKKTPELWPSKNIKYFSPKSFENWVDNKGKDILLVAEHNRKIIGYILCIVSNRGDATITDLCVEVKYRRFGIGSKLLNECYKKLEEKGIEFVDGWVRLGFDEAISFWKKKGFTKGNEFIWIWKEL